MQTDLWLSRWLAIGIFLVLVSLGPRLHLVEGQEPAANAKPALQPSSIQADPQTNTQAKLNRDALKVLETFCSRCHGTTQKLPDFDVMDRASLIKNRGNADKPLHFVYPGQLGKSAMWEYVEGEGAYMPMEGSPEAESITNRDREVLKRWIESGAEYPSQTKRPIRKPLDDLRAIRDHLIRAEPEQRRHLRFFTLSHLSNNQESVRQFDLQLTQAALSKLLNSLSWQPWINLPQEVASSAGTIFAIDLRDYGWSGGREWLQIVNHNPYGLRFQHVKDATLKAIADDIEALSGAQSPIVRADWFVFAASRPPLYHDLLQLPERVESLEQLLELSTLENIRNGKTARAGFGRSGVSRQNRMVERHDTRFGAYWISYDFLPRKGRGDLIRFPLGPRSDNNRFNRHAFEHDGGEVIFSLPNGLQAYFLLTAAGDRINDAAPAEVVFDSAAIAGTPAIINGVSCMNCHREGVVTGFHDEIRNSDALAGEAAEKVKQLYVTQGAMNRLLERDRSRFQTSLEQAIGPFLLNSNKSEKSVDQFPDPIGRVVLRYLADLGPDEIALELGFVSIDSIANQIQFNRDLRKLGLGTLVQQQPGTIKRARWEAVDGTSFFQDVAVELGLGTPILPGSSSLPGQSFQLDRHPLKKVLLKLQQTSAASIDSIPNDSALHSPSSSQSVPFD